MADINISVLDWGLLNDDPGASLPDDLGGSTISTVAINESITAELPQALKVTGTPEAITVAENITMDRPRDKDISESIVIVEDIVVSIFGEPPTAVADGTFTEDTLGMANVFTASVLPRKLTQSPGFLNISIVISGTNEVTLQRSFDMGTTWKDVSSWTASVESTYTDHEIGVRYRLGIKTGDYTSGSAICRLGTGG